MGSQSLIFFYILCFISSPFVLAQQPYVGNLITQCARTDNSSSILGYTCNGQNQSCQAFLIFRSITPYNSVASISALLDSDPSQLSQANSVSINETFGANQQVIVPVICSCSGEYYQANSSYTIESGDNYFIVANNTYQGLSTCQALQNQNNYSATTLDVGVNITVPLRCACPTGNQSRDGVNYLESYLVGEGDDLPTISQRFGVDVQKLLLANGLSGVNSVIYPFTTLLIPLQNQPTINQTITPPPPPPPPSQPPPSPPSDNNSTKTWVYVVIGVAVGAFVLVASIVLFYVVRNKRKSNQIPISNDLDSNEIPAILISDEWKKDEKQSKSDVTKDLIVGISDIGHSLKVYTFKELKLATEDFVPNCNIKGSVYRGVIKGDVAAIKRINGDVPKEIELLKRINHLNLIKLSGVCFSEGQWYLVYEYAENGPLSDWIFNGNDSKVLSWVQRMQIALDVANGLNYLHSYAEPGIVHMDIKSGNILLDGNFRAKIANFGSARSGEGNEGGFALTRHIIGTKGYMAPEYLENGLVSVKLDVYAYGIVMLESITGKEGSIIWEGKDMPLPEVLIAILSKENAKEKVTDFIDPSLQGNYPLDLAMMVARLIERSLGKDPSSRSSMDEIVQSLSKILSASLDWELSNSFSVSQSLALTQN
ncbi:lysM domain receptor-like kinase 4 [Tasmannia lanceolata]|uniref:lysM domain receptor-like kinase 4 n=1 Tax=Tasmannia lanceolata TaxID=3420 RepID=UPI00406410B1